MTHDPWSSYHFILPMVGLWRGMVVLDNPLGTESKKVVH